MTCLRFGTIAVAAVLVAAVGPTDVTAQNLAGTWVLSVALDVGTGDATFVFVVDGDEIQRDLQRRSRRPAGHRHP